MPKKNQNGNCCECCDGQDSHVSRKRRTARQIAEEKGAGALVGHFAKDLGSGFADEIKFLAGGKKNPFW